MSMNAMVKDTSKIGKLKPKVRNTRLLMITIAVTANILKIEYAKGKAFSIIRPIML